MDVPADALPHAWLFGEGQGRWVIAAAADAVAAIEAEAQQAGVAVCRVGSVGGARLTVGGAHAISLDELRSTHERWLPGFMAG